MRKLDNTLYVTSPDAYLAKEGEDVVVCVKGEKDHHLPIHNLEASSVLAGKGLAPNLWRFV